MFIHSRSRPDGMWLVDDTLRIRRREEALRTGPGPGRFPTRDRGRSVADTSPKCSVKTLVDATLRLVYLYTLGMADRDLGEICRVLVAAYHTLLQSEQFCDSVTAENDRTSVRPFGCVTSVVWRG